MRPCNGILLLPLAALSGCFGGPPPAHAPNPERDRQREALQRELEALVSTLPGAVSLYFKDLDTEEILAIRADRPTAAAGLSALFILIETFQRAYEGLLDLDEEIGAAVLMPGDAETSFAPAIAPVSRREPSGPSTSARSLCEALVVARSPTAADILLRRLGGPSAISQALRGRGAMGTSWPSFSVDSNATRPDRIPLTTAADVGGLLEAVARRQAVSPESAAEIARLLALANDGFLGRRLPPDQVAIAHLPANAPGIRHDAGFITCANGSYVLIVLMQNLTDEPAAESAGAELSRLVYTYIQGRPR